MKTTIKKLNKTIKATALFFMMTMIVGSVFGKMTPKKEVFKGVSITPGLGVSSPWIAAGISGKYFNNKFIYDLDISSTNSFSLSNIANTYNHIGLLFGRYIGDKLFRFQYEAGVSYFYGEKYIDNGYYLPSAYEKRNFSTLGLVLKVGARFIPIRYLGIGLDATLNLNNEKSLYTVLLVAECGIIRPKIKRRRQP